MMIETGGWDTHSAQAPRLAAQLRGLDGMLGALREGLGAVWRDTLVLVATEFGRTAAVNGTGGTKCRFHRGNVWQFSNLAQE